MSQNPYENVGNPVSTSALPDSKFSGGSGRYIPLRILSLLGSIGLLAHAAMLFLGSLMGTIGLMMFPGYSDPNQPLSAGLEQTVYFGEIGILLLTLPVYIFNIVIVCMFMYRANSNVRAMGAEGLENTPGWCGGYWFIPLVNLFKPFQCMKEIFLASTNPVGRAWKSVSSPGILGGWWACWLIGNFASRISQRLMTEIDPNIALVLDWFAVLLLVVAAILLVNILRSITKLQTSHASKLISA